MILGVFVLSKLKPIAEISSPLILSASKLKIYKCADTLRMVKDPTYTTIYPTMLILKMEGDAIQGM